jgi:hypothetical protein
MRESQEAIRRKARAQELAWRKERDHTVAETRARFREIAERAGVPAGAVPALVDAAMEAARFYGMECAYANYELRTGRAYPSERREAVEEHAEAEWRGSLARLDEALAAFR